MWDWMRRNLGFPSNEIAATPLAQYPTVADAEKARAGGYGYGDPQSAYIEGKAGNVFGGFKPGGRVDPFVPATPTGPLGKVWDKPQVNLTGQSGISSGLLKDQQDAYTRAHLASNYVPIAALGLEGRNTTADMSGADTTHSGAYNPYRDKMYFAGRNPSALVHEGAHRGLAMVKDRPELPSRLRDRINNMENQETFVRQLMRDYAGDPEQTPYAAQMKRIVDINPTPKADIAALNDLVAQIMKERRPRGPR